MRNNTQVVSDVCGNAAQMEAILHKDGPAMVLAGPGSGKTFVIVQRLRCLIEEYQVDPSSVLVITFTKAAAIEMQQRFLKITDSSYPEVCFGTFHSVFYQIIRRSNPKDNISIVNEITKFKIIKDIVLEVADRRNLPKNQLSDILEDIKDIISEISRVKNTDIDILSYRGSNSFSAIFSEIFLGYNNRLKEFGLIDFDDMIIRCFEELRKSQEMRKLWSEKFRYILIDEYQDINPMQQRVIELLCENNNLFVVGDDDQSIYGFRGSDPSIMMQFKEKYADKNAKIINLNVNYRCGKDILDNALLLVEQNKKRLNKKLSADVSNGKGHIYARRYANLDKQNKAIVSFLENNSELLGKIAFIFRTNQEAATLARVLKAAGFDTNLDNVTTAFYEAPAVKLCEDYLKFIYLGNRREDFLKIMNKPSGYISRQALTKDIVDEKELLDFYRGNADKRKEITILFRNLKMIKGMRPQLAVRYLRKEVGIEKIYQDQTECLDELSALSLKVYDNRELLKEIANHRLNSSDNKKASGNKKNCCIQLLTMHGSKGLEFDTVWIPDLNEGIIPSRSSVTLPQIEEERRMLYVGMTRAKKALILSYLTGDKENPRLPSRFLRPIRHLWEIKES